MSLLFKELCDLLFVFFALETGDDDKDEDENGNERLAEIHVDDIALFQWRLAAGTRREMAWPGHSAFNDFCVDLGRLKVESHLFPIDDVLI